MDRDLDVISLKAGHVVPSPGEVIENGRVLVRGTKIVDVGCITAFFGLFQGYWFCHRSSLSLSILAAMS